MVTVVFASGSALAGFTSTLDAAGQRTSEASDAGRPVNSVTFDAQGQVMLALGGAAGRTVHYNYDIDGRLTSELITNVPNTPNRTISSTYDLAGNRRLKLDYTATPQDSRTTYTYDADDRLTVASLGPYYPASGGQGGIQSSDTRYTYDLDGHTLTATVSRGNTTLSTTMNTWDIEGHLVEVMTTDTTQNTTTTTDFAYDAAGNRVAQRTGG